MKRKQMVKEKDIVNYNKEKVKEYEEIRKSDLPKGLKDILLLGKLLEMKTSSGKTVSKRIVESFKQRKSD